MCKAVGISLEASDSTIYTTPGSTGLGIADPALDHHGVIRWRLVVVVSAKKRDRILNVCLQTYAAQVAFESFYALQSQQGRETRFQLPQRALYTYPFDIQVIEDPDTHPQTVDLVVSWQMPWQATRQDYRLRGVLGPGVGYDGVPEYFVLMSGHEQKSQVALAAKFTGGIEQPQRILDVARQWQEDCDLIVF